MSRKKRRQEVLTVGAVVLLILVMIYSGLRILESTVFAYYVCYLYALKPPSDIFCFLVAFFALRVPFF